MNLAIAGCGRHGLRYAAHLLGGDVPGARLVAVSRRDTVAGGEYAAQNGLRFIPSAIELAAAPGIDGVILCLPPDQNELVVRAALQAGRAVLVEKPMAAGLSAARSILDAASTGLVSVAHTLRFNHVARALARHVPELGQLQACSVSQRHAPPAIEWIEHPDRGGAVRVMGVHGFDLACHLSGTHPVKAYCEVLRPAPERADHAFSAVLRLEPGPVLASVDTSRFSSGRTGHVSVSGRDGTLVGDFVHGHLNRVRDGRLEPVPLDAPVPTVRECLRAFLAAARGESANAVTAREGFRAVAMMDACLRSAELGRPVPVEAT